jgi:hypothetical protein
MHYMDLTTKFGRFNKDNMYRWETAGYLNWSNELLGEILKAPGGAAYGGYVAQADKYAAAAVTTFNGWNYGLSASYAKKAYWTLAQVAKTLGIPTPDAAQADLGDINPDVPHEGDPIRFPDN